MLASTIIIADLVAMAQVEEEPWEVVTSREGKFTVEMPAVPSQEGSVPILGPAG